ncbi:MAG: histidinol-phosphate transaminase [Clostridia bacterium]|nr:histidinol-phosphate transaminase [Clostridia bacterium]
MSRFFTSRFSALTPYTPGEQPKDTVYIKLNTNESPFPPSDAVRQAAAYEAERLQLYSDPECRDLNRTAADFFGVGTDQILMTNGSDEILNFAFMAFGDETNPFVFPSISYGFYPVFAALNRIPYKEIPLTEDFRIDVSDYQNLDSNIVIANPNAPTGLYLTPDEVEFIVKNNKNHVVVIDEAYIDFGGESALPLVQKYDNLLVTRTFSKSYSLAGARLGFGIGSPALIADMNTIKYSTNPYNVNRMTMAAGKAAIEDASYYRACCDKIIATRERVKKALTALGFAVTDSKANFLFAAHNTIGGKELYLALREKGILIRHFDLERIKNYNRITVGTDQQMDTLLTTIQTILKGNK